MRIKFCSVSNKNSANALDSSVFPTPVGPKKMKLPIGLCGSANPERERLIAKEAAKLALEELSGEFYKRVGKTIIEKVLIWIGMLVVGYVFGKGWIIKA